MGFGCIVSADGFAQRASVCSRYSSSASVEIIKNNNEREVFYACALGTDTAPELQKLRGPSAATFALLLICNWDSHLVPMTLSDHFQTFTIQVKRLLPLEIILRFESMFPNLF